MQIGQLITIKSSIQTGIPFRSIRYLPTYTSFSYIIDPQAILFLFFLFQKSDWRLPLSLRKYIESLVYDTIEVTGVDYVKVKPALSLYNTRTDLTTARSQHRTGSHARANLTERESWLSLSLAIVRIRWYLWSPNSLDLTDREHPHGP